MLRVVANVYATVEHHHVVLPTSRCFIWSYDLFLLPRRLCFCLSLLVVLSVSRITQHVI